VIGSLLTWRALADDELPSFAVSLMKRCRDGGVVFHDVSAEDIDRAERDLRRGQPGGVVLGRLCPHAGSLLLMYAAQGNRLGLLEALLEDMRSGASRNRLPGMYGGRWGV
jgi:hypothetical protein